MCRGVVQVGIGVTVLHRDAVKQVDDVRQQGRSRDREPRVLHVLGVRRALTAELAQEWEDLLADDLVHDSGLELLEPRPAARLARA